MDTNKLTELRKEIDKYRPLDSDQIRALNKDIRVEHIWSSNAIEGSKIDKFETEAIIDKGITIHGESIGDVLSTIDLNEAYDYMLDLASHKQPLSQTTIRDLNRLALAKTHPEWGGEYRALEVHPAKTDFNPYTEPFDIRPEMDNLIEWSRKAQKEMHPVKYAADLHYKFVTIHPFRDGNGRTARLLMSLALTENGYPVVNIMPDKESREEYMETLLDSQKRRDPTAFEDLVGKYTEKTLKKRIQILQLNEKNKEEAREDTNLSKKRMNELAKRHRFKNELRERN
ncbi:cell filamentation protein Fic [Lactobacillus taiwanensis]|uniref:Cell filamentation protein Fic n=1 Tax=Lactobacillus taiwanensis TaxID=508451 RepID=A0A256LHV9_9LACO|nr:Fic family protein [Lactobacillus taiwanensis]OYR88907.1 cell filamentation protein Fic [Lactobacillus taiwanensis]OYR92984.1 cell filamentation protein Fic [Lactobacillus taiwanensis]OYR93590.1 cell filamentation protein Fic [Lactobacillus taiwanensis]OYR97112.1 cell filamentation protein Fic [Lactobacillus taiwanensis]OYR98059.1 cell filamentation protein Fic [Lactobacillus taiwanensis]